MTNYALYANTLSSDMRYEIPEHLYFNPRGVMRAFHNYTLVCEKLHMH